MNQGGRLDNRLSSPSLTMRQLLSKLAMADASLPYYLSAWSVYFVGRIELDNPQIWLYTGSALRCTLLDPAGKPLFACARISSLLICE